MATDGQKITRRKIELFKFSERMPSWRASFSIGFHTYAFNNANNNNKIFKFLKAINLTLTSCSHSIEKKINNLPDERHSCCSMSARERKLRCGHFCWRWSVRETGFHRSLCKPMKNVAELLFERLRVWSKRFLIFNFTSLSNVVTSWRRIWVGRCNRTSFMRGQFTPHSR